MAARNGAGVSSEHVELLDEAQLEVKRSMVKFKTVRVSVMEVWDDKEKKMVPSDEAKAAIAVLDQFKKDQLQQTGKVWSDIGHTDVMYYTGYCRAGELATTAVRLSGEYYKLNVPLTAGYTLGRTWAETH
jgi:hypothetical protein